MFILSNVVKYRHLLVDADIHTYEDLHDATGLSISTIRAIRRGDEVSPESLHTLLGKLLHRSVEAKVAKDVST